MSTKAPSSVEVFSADSLEKVAYGIVADIQTREPNDRNRLGYCLWAWLKERKGTLDQAIRNSGVRTRASYEEVYAIISKRLEEKGIKIS